MSKSGGAHRSPPPGHRPPARPSTMHRPSSQHGMNHRGVGMAVRVIVRKRPVAAEQLDVLEVHSPVVVVHEHKVKVDLTRYEYAHSYAYDDTFSEEDSTAQLYERSVHGLVTNMFDGGTSTAFCFGQTASGKTFTLFGAGGGQQEMSDMLREAGREAEAAQAGGVYLLGAYEIFQRLQAGGGSLGNDAGDGGLAVSLSMYEIKGQKLHDLLNSGSDLTALEDGNGVLQLVGLTQVVCPTLEEFLEVSNAGRSTRSTAATGANATSSRSHCTMLVRLSKDGEPFGKLSLIDLAGSERGADNENTDAVTRKEGRDINTSLLALKEVIRSLQKGIHAPFRQSRLTQVLEESLTGQQAKTVVIACVSGAEKDTHHTVNTLRYAQELRPKKKGLAMALHAETVQTKLKSPKAADAEEVERVQAQAMFDAATRAAKPSRPKPSVAKGGVLRRFRSEVTVTNVEDVTTKGKGGLVDVDSKNMSSSVLVKKKSVVGANGKNHTGVGYSVRVIVRKRPVPKDQLDVLEVAAPAVVISEQKVKVDLTKYVEESGFTYDDAFGEKDSTAQLYQRSVHDLVGNMFEGGTSTAFCFGQTASGKTFTLFGAGGGQQVMEDVHLLEEAGHEAEAAQGGVYLISAYEIYLKVHDLVELDPNEKTSVTLSMYEIKGQKLHDLLDEGKDLTALEDGNGVLQLVGLRQVACATLEDFLLASNVGRTARSTTATGANATSSRSHCAMLVRVYKGDTLLGKLSLIDLAGSERGVDNENTDVATRKEGRDINTSLLALKEVIRALQKGNHAPFRQSRLTQVLQESLTGQQCRTVVIACVSGAEKDTHHTVNTLRYAEELRPNAPKGSKFKNSARSLIMARRPAKPTKPAVQFQAQSATKSAAPVTASTRPSMKKAASAIDIRSAQTSSSRTPSPRTKKRKSLDSGSISSASSSKSKTVLGGLSKVSKAPGTTTPPPSRPGSHKQAPHRRSARANGQNHGVNHGGVGMSVRVVVRKRPVPPGHQDALDVSNPPEITVYEQKVKVDLARFVDEYSFVYDDAFSEVDSTNVLYERAVHDLVSNMFESGTSTAFCFGQTASGKTFTLFGASGGKEEMHDGQTVGNGAQGGVYLMAAFEIFERVHDLVELDPNEKTSVTLSMYEIKGQKLHDLLDEGKDLTALEDGNGVLQLVGLTQVICKNLEDFLEASNVGRSTRSTAATGANATSSRSHCAMLVRTFKGGKLVGKMNLIDLAGSERGADNENTDAVTRKEGRDINTSLLALKEVIRSLQKGIHAPFRQSRLTQVLEESLTGQQAKTVVIACVSGAEKDTHHTLNTLRYAQDLRPSSGKAKFKSAVKAVAAKKRGTKKGNTCRPPQTVAEARAAKLRENDPATAAAAAAAAAASLLSTPAPTTPGGGGKTRGIIRSLLRTSLASPGGTHAARTSPDHSSTSPSSSFPLTLPEQQELISQQAELDAALGLTPTQQPAAAAAAPTPRRRASRAITAAVQSSALRLKRAYSGRGGPATPTSTRKGGSSSRMQGTSEQLPGSLAGAGQAQGEAVDPAARFRGKGKTSSTVEGQKVGSHLRDARATTPPPQLRQAQSEARAKVVREEADLFVEAERKEMNSILSALAELEGATDGFDGVGASGDFDGGAEDSLLSEEGGGGVSGEEEDEGGGSRGSGGGGCYAGCMGASRFGGGSQRCDTANRLLNHELGLLDDDDDDDDENGRASINNLVTPKASSQVSRAAAYSERREISSLGNSLDVSPRSSRWPSDSEEAEGGKGLFGTQMGLDTKVQKALEKLENGEDSDDDSSSSSSEEEEGDDDDEGDDEGDEEEGEAPGNRENSSRDAVANKGGTGGGAGSGGISRLGARVKPKMLPRLSNNSAAAAAKHHQQQQQQQQQQKQLEEAEQEKAKKKATSSTTPMRIPTPTKPKPARRASGFGVWGQSRRKSSAAVPSAATAATKKKATAAALAPVSKVAAKETRSERLQREKREKQQVEAARKQQQQQKQQKHTSPPKKQHPSPDKHHPKGSPRARLAAAKGTRGGVGGSGGGGDDAFPFAGTASFDTSSSPQDNGPSNNPAHPAVSFRRIVPNRQANGGGGGSGGRGGGGGARQSRDDMDFLLALGRGEGMLGDAPWEAKRATLSSASGGGGGGSSSRLYRRSMSDPFVAGANGAWKTNDLALSSSNDTSNASGGNTGGLSTGFSTVSSTPSDVGAQGHAQGSSNGRAAGVLLGGAAGKGAPRAFEIQHVGKGDAVVRSEELDSEVLKSNYVRNQSKRLTLMMTQLMGDGEALKLDGLGGPSSPMLV